MGIEIERKYLVDETAFLVVKPNAVSVSEITQGYLKTSGSTVRIRYGKKWVAAWPEPQHFAYITIKGKSVGISRPEFEYDIPYYDAKDLIKMCSSVLEKTRYMIRHSDGHMWSVDVFKGLNDGLLLAEIELQNEEEEFEIPMWATTDVSCEKQFTNSFLAKNKVSR